MNWNNLLSPWQIAFREAWTAFCSDAFPVGAAVVNPSGVVVAAGRNTVRGLKPTTGFLHGNKLGHAEINALLQINERQYPDYQQFTLFSTAEPCPLCLGAMVMSKLRKCCYAARDPIAGSAGLATASDYLARRELQFIGPEADLEILQIALLSAFMLEHRPSEVPRFVGSWNQYCPKGTDLGQRLFRNGSFFQWKMGQTPVEKIFDELCNPNNMPTSSKFQIKVF